MICLTETEVTVGEVDHEHADTAEDHMVDIVADIDGVMAVVVVFHLNDQGTGVTTVHVDATTTADGDCKWLGNEDLDTA